MDKDLILEVKKKREFKKLPNSLIESFLKKNNLEIKDTRAELRKYFGVFLTNKVLKGLDESVLSNHISSKDRDYDDFYKKIFKGIRDTYSVIDLGCGVSGFSYPYLNNKFEGINYLGIEAAGQLVENMNKYFLNKGFENAEVRCMNLLEQEDVFNLIKESSSPRVILMLQVIDAMENLSKNLSKEFLIELKDTLGTKDLIIISMPMKSISGKKRFEADRAWLRNFLNDEFNLIDEFIVGNERIFRIRKN
jgi:hypothetical protein